MHVEKGNAAGKIWLELFVEIAYMKKFDAGEIHAIQEIIKANSTFFKNKWNEHFTK